MSIALMTLTWQTALPLNQKAALLAMADWANDNGTSIHPSIYALSERLTCSERTTQRLVRDLEVGGWIAVIGNAKGGAPGTTRRYGINVRKLREAATAEEARRAKSRRSSRYRADEEVNPFDLEDGCQIDTGAKLSPLGRVTNQVETGDKPRTRRVTNQVETGDTGDTLSVIEPPVDPSENLSGPAVAAPPAAAKKPAKAKKKAAASEADETALQAACRATWAAYSCAYEQRYSAKPVRNASVSAKVRQFVQRIGHDESPAVAQFYVERVTDSFVVRKVHDVGLLLSGAEGYRTQWAAGSVVNAAPAIPNRQEALEARNRAVGEQWLRDMQAQQQHQESRHA